MKDTVVLPVAVRVKPQSVTYATVTCGGTFWLTVIVSPAGHHSRVDEPLLQFARHVRNACAHGDRWHFTGIQPEHPAACRELVVTAALQGRRATWETVTPRRYVEFLDDISNFFLPGLVPSPVNEVDSS